MMRKLSDKEVKEHIKENMRKHKEKYKDEIKLRSSRSEQATYFYETGKFRQRKRHLTKEQKQIEKQIYDKKRRINVNKEKEIKLHKSREYQSNYIYEHEHSYDRPTKEEIKLSKSRYEQARKIYNPDYRKIYQNNHKKEKAEYSKKYDALNKEHANIIRRERLLKNGEYKEIERSKEWKLNNLDKVLIKKETRAIKGWEAMEKWNIDNPEKCKKNKVKAKSKRRKLGSHPLNEPFPNSEAHHINHNVVVYIPSEIHKSIWHNGNTKRGMNEINTLAINYLFETEDEI